MESKIMDYKDFLKQLAADDLFNLGFNAEPALAYDQLITLNPVPPVNLLPPTNVEFQGPQLPTPKGVVKMPGTIWDPSTNKSRRPSGTVIDTIVLHTTDSGSEKGDLNWLKGNGGSSVSCHFLIFRDGTIYQLVDLNEQSYHAGVSVDSRGKKGVNSYSIGIEIANKGDNKESYKQAQIQAVIKIIQFCKSVYPIIQIVSHSHIGRPKGRKADPAGFPWDQLKFLNIPLYP